MIVESNNVFYKLKRQLGEKTPVLISTILFPLLMRFHRCPKYIFCIKNNNKNHELFITHLWKKEMHDAILNPVTSIRLFWNEYSEKLY